MTVERPAPKTESIFPQIIDPMIPKPVNRPIRNHDWIAEIKLNGFRAIAYLEKDQPPIVRTSVGRDVASTFPELKPGFERLTRRHNLILDGEIVYGEGKTADEMRTAVGRTKATPFTAHFNSELSPCQYVAFDLLYLDGEDLTHLPLSERKKKLSRTVTNTHAKGKIIRSLYTSADRNLLEVARQNGYEGVVYKNPQSLYIPGQKTSDWLKYKF